MKTMLALASFRQSFNVTSKLVVQREQAPAGAADGQTSRRNCSAYVRVRQDAGNERALCWLTAVKVNKEAFSVQRGEGRLVHINALPAVWILSVDTESCRLPTRIHLSKPACEIGLSASRISTLDSLLSATNSTQSCLDLR